MTENEPTTPISIHEYTDEYKDQVRDVIGRTLAAIDVIDPKALPIDDPDLEEIEKIYSGNGRFWVALKDGQVIGTVALRDMGNQTARLNRMFVLVEHHGTGLGQQLFDTAIEFAKKQGFQKVTLNTHENMRRAHTFYEKNGFHKIGEAENKFQYERVLQK